MGSELVISEETIAALDKAAENGIIAQQQASQFKRMMMVSVAIGELKKLLTPKVMEPVMHLQNTSLGFRTDKPVGYGVDVVRDCLIEATLKGVYPVGNEFNIISERCYITKEGYFHKLRDIPDFTWVEVPGIPRAGAVEGNAIIKMRLEWTLKGKKFDKELEIPVRVNKGMGADAIIGKATRKARAWLYTTVTGQEIGDGDVEGSDAIDVEAKEVEKSPFEEPPKPEASGSNQGEFPM